jgi:signal transduction histidine kinase
MKSTRIFLSLLLFGTAASIHLSAAAPAAEKHPGFQARRLWSPPPGLNADVAMAYGIGQRMPVRFARFDTPFELSDRPSEDREAVSGPPWWSPRTLIFTGLAVLGIVFLSQHLYLLATHWRLRAVMEERAHLAHEIHDTLAQSFAGIGFQLQAIRNSMPPNSSALERQVDLAMELTRSSHDEVRRSIASLRPETHGQIGLVPALRSCAERMITDGSVKVETYCGDGAMTIPPRIIPPRIKDTLIRIGKEAIANSIRHADPSTIRIRVHHHRASICLSVEDDGVGFVTNGDCAGFGLVGMRKRAESISATLFVRSMPGSGTQVEVRAPLKARFYIVAWPKLLFHT